MFIYTFDKFINQFKFRNGKIDTYKILKFLQVLRGHYYNTVEYNSRFSFTRTFYRNCVQGEINHTDNQKDVISCTHMINLSRIISFRIYKLQELPRFENFFRSSCLRSNIKIEKFLINVTRCFSIFLKFLNNLFVSFCSCWAKE